jgi:hypothetical protein
MRSALRSGVAVACRCWPIVGILFAVSFASALIFGAVAWSWLSVSLGKSLATRTLLTDLDAQVFIDLFVHHREGFALLLVSAALLAACCWLLGVWLNAVAVAAVARDVSWLECPLQGCRAYPTYLCLCATVNVIQAAALVALFLLGRALTRWTADSTSEMTFYWISGGAALVGALAVFFFATVHDHARIRVARTGAGALRALGWAFGFVGRREGRALLLALVLLCGSLLIWLLYQGVSSCIRTDSALRVALSLLWGEALLLTRTFVRVWWFASTAQLQAAAERPAYWAQGTGQPAA